MLNSGLELGNTTLFKSFMFTGKAALFPPNGPIQGRKSHTKRVYHNVFCSALAGQHNENLCHNLMKPCWPTPILLYLSTMPSITLFLFPPHYISVLIPSSLLAPSLLYAFSIPCPQVSSCLISSSLIFPLLPPSSSFPSIHELLFSFLCLVPWLISLWHVIFHRETSGSSYCLSWRWAEVGWEEDRLTESKHWCFCLDKSSEVTIHQEALQSGYSKQPGMWRTNFTFCVKSCVSSCSQKN